LYCATDFSYTLLIEHFNFIQKNNDDMDKEFQDLEEEDEEI